MDFDIQIEILEDHAQFLHCKITSPEHPAPFLCTFVYAANERRPRRALWRGLRRNVSTMPWMVVGDFNIVMKAEEKEGGQDIIPGAVEEFCECAEYCGIEDAGYEGTKYTWSSRGIRTRLDRALINLEWANCFNMTRIKHSARRQSDHNPLIITFNKDGRRKPGSFRFQNMWTHHHGFLDTMRINWGHPTHHTGVLALDEKLRRGKQHLRWWNKAKFGDIFQNIREKEEKLREA